MLVSYVFSHPPAAVAFVATLAVWFLGERVLTIRDWRSGALKTKQDAGSTIWIVVCVVVGMCGGFAVASTSFTKLPAPGVWLVLGLAVAWAGILLRFWAVLTLGRSFTTKVMVRHEQTVATAGPYRWVRHPSYLGLLAIFFGIGLALGNLAAAVVMVAVPTVGLVKRITVEEAALREEIGASYAEYCNDRARLVPGIW